MGSYDVTQVLFRLLRCKFFADAWPPMVGECGDVLQPGTVFFHLPLRARCLRVVREMCPCRAYAGPTGPPVIAGSLLVHGQVLPVWTWVCTFPR